MMADPQFGVDALIPADMAAKAELVGVRKAGADFWTTFVLAVLAGAFISLGAIFSTTVAAGSTLPYGVTRLLAGLVFTLGLILVIVGGAELFTGNALIVMAWANKKVSHTQLLRNWSIVFLGNFVGSGLTALLSFWSGQYTFGKGAVGLAALATADTKTSLDPVAALFLGILCNGLVCLAVWLTMSARSTTDKMMAIVPPIAAFVASGYEHSIANMYFIPIGLLIKSFAPASFWIATARTPADYPTLTVDRFLLSNLLPVTLGNIIGGTVLVASAYWFVYLRKRQLFCDRPARLLHLLSTEDALSPTPQ